MFFHLRGRSIFWSYMDLSRTTVALPLLTGTITIVESPRRDLRALDSSG